MHDVKLHVRPWLGDQQAAVGSVGTALVVDHITVDGRDIWGGKDNGEVRLTVGLSRAGPMGFLTLVIEGADEETCRLFGPDEYLVGTDEETLVLPVRSIEVEQSVYA